MFRYYYESAGAATAPPSSDFATEMAALSPTAWWRLGESSGTTATDEQGVQNGTYVNAPTLGVSGITTDGDTGISLAAASSQRVQIADNAAWDVGTSDFTLLVGISVTGSWPSTSQWVFVRGNGNGSEDYGFYLRGSATGDLRASMVGTTYTFSTDPTISWVDAGWHLVIMAFDRSDKVHLYVDGSEFGTGIDISGQSAVDLTGNNELNIGSTDSPTLFLDHSVDEVAIWNGTLLTGSDAATLYGAL